MTKLRFALSLALCELRHGVRRVGVYMASITLGVATLVSIHSFRADVAREVLIRDDREANLEPELRSLLQRLLEFGIDGIEDAYEEAGALVATAPG